MRMGRTSLATACLVGVLAAACGPASGPGGPEGDADEGPGRASPGPGSAGPGRDDRPIVVRGTIRAGVEPGCLVLRASGVAYLLLGPGLAGLSPGQAVTVTGVVSTKTVTSCMQGTPLLVEQVAPRSR